VWHDDDVTPLPPPDPRAFTLLPGGDVVGVALCVHGYTGTPYEVRPLADALCARGFVVHAPLLTGHGADPAVCNRTSWRTWLDDVVAAWDALATQAPSTGLRVVVGSSMGGLLALQLSLVRELDALVLLAPALRFFPAQTAAVAALAAGLWRARPFLPKEAPGGDVGDVDAQRNNPTYKVLPSHGVVELRRLQSETARALSRVTAPVCALHGARDHTIAPSSSVAIAAGVSSALVEHHVLARTQHLVGIDVERDDVCRLALRFVDDVRTRKRNASTKEAA
jgi:carboxylesterase